MNATNTFRVLVIDDNPAIHDDFRKVLCGGGAAAGSSGAAGAVAELESALFGDDDANGADPGAARFDVDAALQGEQGVQMLKASIDEGRPYAMAFIDMRMPPGWDGVQTIRELWKVSRNFLVVICTAYSDYSPAQIAAELRSDGRMIILRKPFDPIEVRQLATTMCQKWELSRHKADLERIVETRTAELKRQASHDTLTGLANRALFNERLGSVLQRCKRYGTNAAVLFIDVDGFKLVNDSLGHEAGDALLLQIAERLSVSVREFDTVARVDEHGVPEINAPDAPNASAIAARIGGDEFAIILEHIGNDANAARVAQRLLSRTSEPYPINGRQIYCTTSIGITTSSLGYERAEVMLRDADTAMYQAKRTGRARFVMFDQRMHADAILRLNFESDLRSAIDAGQIEVHYQPIQELSSSRLVGFEALARWNHATRGAVPPVEFIALAEEIGLIGPLGQQVLTRACRQLAEWQNRWPNLVDVTMSVNVSRRQLITSDFVEFVARTMRETGIKPTSLKLEITESSVMSDGKKAMDMLKRIQALDVKIQMDDFGSGYSSLSCLQTLALDGMKIDRDFVKDIATRADQAAVVRSVVGLAHTLNLPLVAEGVETHEQQRKLQEMGCDHVQGFLYAKPMSPEDASKFIADTIKSHPSKAA
jgi:predicted signal transduction protein with EAL and GGDEF domain